MINDAYTNQQNIFKDVSTILPQYEWEEEKEFGKFTVTFDRFAYPEETNTLSDEWNNLIKGVIYSLVNNYDTKIPKGN